MSLILGMGMLWRSLFWAVGLRDAMAWGREIAHRPICHLAPPQPTPRDDPPPDLGISGLYRLGHGGRIAGPQLVQQVIVQPNELQRERPYIERAIAQTRAAFDLADINVQPFDAGRQPHL
jgi:hypothetical protein